MIRAPRCDAYPRSVDLFTAALLIILFGPIVWAVTAGRNARPPDVEDRDGYTAVNEQIRRQTTDWRQ